ALNLWRDRPDLVRSLVLADTWANHAAAAASHAERMAAIDAGTMPELARIRMPGVYAPGADPELVERGVAAFAALDKAAYRAASEDGDAEREHQQQLDQRVEPEVAGADGSRHEGVALMEPGGQRSPGGEEVGDLAQRQEGEPGPEQTAGQGG